MNHDRGSGQSNLMSAMHDGKSAADAGNSGIWRLKAEQTWVVDFERVYCRNL